MKCDTGAEVFENMNSVSVTGGLTVAVAAVTHMELESRRKWWRQKDILRNNY